MKLGIVGLPNIGKTTLFNAMTGRKAETSSYAMAATVTNLGSAEVPDERLNWLYDLYKPKKLTFATIDFVDIAGVKKSASGGGMTNSHLAQIRQCDALVELIRCFDDNSIFSERAAPAEDVENFELELILSDLELMERKLERSRKAAKADKKMKETVEFLESFIAHLSDGKSAKSFKFKESELAEIEEAGLLSLKPVIYIANLSEDSVSNFDEDEYYIELREYLKDRDALLLPLCAKIEAEISELEAEEQQVFLEELGIGERALNLLIKASYSLLGYISFFTVGEDEVRAWTIVNGTKAQRAAGKIHSDLERGFIRAEICAFDDMKASGSWNNAKNEGLVRIEGKEYIMKDGDITNIRFNV